MLSSDDDWFIAEPHIAAALTHCGDTHSLDDVLEMISEGAAALFVGDHSAIVTQEFELLGGRQLHFWLAGGELEELAEMERDIEKAARDKGITRLSIIGRRGWGAVLEGFQERAVILIKDI